MLIVGGCSTGSTPDPLSGPKTVAWFIDKYGEVSSPSLGELLTKVQARLRVATAVIVGQDPKQLNLRVFSYREPLAFSTVGGEILFSKGLILSLESEDELAAVVAHELSHALLGHLQEIETATPKSEAPQFVLSMDREVEADRFSLSLIQAAGYDPLATLKVLRRLSGGESEAREQALATELAKISSTTEPRGNNRLFRRVQAELTGLEERSRLRETPW